MGGVYRIQTFLDFYIFFIFTRPLSMLLYSVHRITFQHDLSPSILEKNKNKLFHRKSQCIIYGVGARWSGTVLPQP